jgi:hypothetical protein
MADIPVRCSFTLTALRNSPFSVNTCTLPSSNTRRCPCVSQDTSIGFSSCPFARPRIPKHCRDRPELAEYIFILDKKMKIICKNHYSLPAISSVSYGDCLPIHGESKPTGRGQLLDVTLSILLVVQTNIGNVCPISVKYLDYTKNILQDIQLLSSCFT